MLYFWKAWDSRISNVIFPCVKYITFTGHLQDIYRTFTGAFCCKHPEFQHPRYLEKYPLERANYKINDVPQMSMFCIQICSQGGDRPNTKTLGHNCGSCPHLFKAQQQDWVRWRRDCLPMHQSWGSLNLIHLSSDCSSRDPTPSPPQVPQISKIVAKWLPTREWIIEATRTQPSLGWPARG